MEEERNTEEIDLMELFRMLLSRWYVVAISLLAVLALTAAYAYGIRDDVYTSEASVLVAVDTGAGEHLDFQLSQRMVDTYTEVAESRRVTRLIREELDLTYSDGVIRNMIDVRRGRGDSIVIKFGVESQDPAEAALMANAIVGIMEDLSDEMESLYPVEILDTAEISVLPSGPNRPLFMAVGFVLGGMVGVLVVFGIEFFDRSVKSTKDLETKLNLRVLGTIPEYAMDKEVEE